MLVIVCPKCDGPAERVGQGTLDRIKQLEAALREVLELSRMRSPHAWSSEADYFRIARAALEGKDD